MRYRILPYKQGSKSAKALATALGGKVLKLEGSSFKPLSDDVVINWGNTAANPDLTLLNPSAVILGASNKLSFFQLMQEKGVDCLPKFWTSSEDIPAEAYPIVCRTVLAGHSGAGIHITASPEGIVEAPLYVQYVKKKDEYRIHLGRKFLHMGYCDHDQPIGSYHTNVIAVQKKAKKHDAEHVDWQVRNHANGFIYKRNEVDCPGAVFAAATAAFEASGLDFGAVDVIWNEQKEKAYVLEINTAPGLEGQTSEDYANFFRGSA